VGKWSLLLNLVFLPLISRLDSNWSLLLTINIKREKIYCDLKGRISNCLKSSLHVSLYPELDIILMPSFATYTTITRHLYLILLSIDKYVFSSWLDATTLLSDILHSHQSYLYFDNPCDTVTSEPAHYKLFIFHVLNVVSIFHHLGRLFKKSIQV
jgi:hypothetical protein